MNIALRIPKHHIHNYTCNICYQDQMSGGIKKRYQEMSASILIPRILFEGRFYIKDYASQIKWNRTKIRGQTMVTR